MRDYSILTLIYIKKRKKRKKTTAKDIDKNQFVKFFCTVLGSQS